MSPWLLLGAFVGAVAEAVLVWWLVSRTYAAQLAFLQGQLEASGKTITGLVDRVQAPTTKEFVARKEAEVLVEDRKLLTPEEREKIRLEQTVESILQDEAWRSRPEFDGYNVVPDPEGGGVLVIGPDDPETGLPSIEKMSRFEFAGIVMQPRQ